VSRLIDQIKVKRTAWDLFRYVPIESAARGDSAVTIEWAEISGTTLFVHLLGTETNDASAIADISLLTADGLRSVDALSHDVDGDRVSLTCTLNRSIEEALGMPIVLDCKARPTRRSPYVVLRALVMCPEEIRLPAHVKRVRAAVRALQRREARTDDVREVLAFVQGTLSNLLSHMDVSTGGTGRRQPLADASEAPDAPGVLFAPDESAAAIALAFSATDASSGLLRALPAIFRALLGDRGSKPAVARDWGKETSESTDEEDAEPDSEDEDQYDIEAVEGEAREFFQWAYRAFQKTPDSEAQAVRAWPVQTYLLEFTLIFLRFFYRRDAAQDSAALSEYLVRSRQLLMVALSTAGAAWEQPTGWFIRARQILKGSSPTLPATVIARAVHHVYELYLSESHRKDAMPLRHLLEGCDRMAPGRGECERDPRVQTQLPILLAESHGGADAAESVCASLSELRQLKTPEEAAAAKFMLLLQLQDAAIGLSALQRPALPVAVSPSEKGERDQQLAEAVTRFEEMKSRCLLAFPDETNVYLQLASRGRPKAFVSLDHGGASCPSCHLGLPKHRAADLRVMTKVTQCPSCLMLILPLPKRYLDDTRDAEQV
jgi:hypothetical protein